MLNHVARRVFVTQQANCVPRQSTFEFIDGR
jgi:hypothetical protein